MSTHYGNIEYLHRISSVLPEEYGFTQTMLRLAADEYKELYEQYLALQKSAKEAAEEIEKFLAISKKSDFVFLP